MTDTLLQIEETDPNLRDGSEQGVMPLHLAAEGGHCGVAELLLGAKADVNARDYLHFRAPLHCAAEKR